MMTPSVFIPFSENLPLVKSRNTGIRTAMDNPAERIPLKIKVWDLLRISLFP